MKSLFSRKTLLLSAGIALAVMTVYGVARFLPGPNASHPKKNGAVHASTSDDEEVDEDARLTVKTIHPKNDPNFVRSVTAPAYVEAYYRADLFAQIAGPVKYIQKNIGDPVYQGEILIEIDVPEVEQEILQKEVLIEQAKKERDAALAKEQSMKEAVESARNHVLEKKTSLEQALAIKSLREAELKRFQILASKQAALSDLVDERVKDVQIATSAAKAAELAIQTAQSEYREYVAKLAEAKADIYVKEARIVAAQKARERAEVQAEWAKIRAPFNGTIIARSVDPGSFVQNATTARTQPMLSLIRSDIVTISMMVPERSAPYVKVGTDAFITIDTEPGRPPYTVQAKVTRFSPYLDPEKGRTMRAEVDIFNPPTRNFNKGLQRAQTTMLTPLAAQGPVQALVLNALSQQQLNRPGILRPGMYGNMRLVLQRFEGANVVPSSAIVSREGKTFVFLVKDGKAVRAPVRVLLEDGARSRIAFFASASHAQADDEEDLRDLDGSEEIIASGQGELSEGQEVKHNLVEW